MSPHIEQERRKILNPDIESLINWISTGGKREGEIAYILARLGIGLYGKSWAEFCSFAGTIILFLLEYWWNVVRKYEENKAKLHGDAFKE